MSGIPAGIFALWILKEILGYDLSSGSAGSVSSYVTDLLGDKPNLAARLSLSLVAAFMVFFGLLTARSKAFRRAEQGLPKHD